MNNLICSHCGSVYATETEVSGVCEHCVEEAPLGYFPIPSPVEGGSWEWFDRRWIFITKAPELRCCSCGCGRSDNGGVGASGRCGQCENYDW